MHEFRGLLICVAVLVSVALVGCTQENSQDPAALEGVQWTLSASSETDLTKLGIIAKFDGVRMMGFSGVNSYTGPYEASSTARSRWGRSHRR